jgi:hypothetical protein
MEDRRLIDRADRVINLIRMDELCEALKEFEIEDFGAGWNAAKRVYRPESFESAEDQADGSGGSGQSNAIPELHRRLHESLRRIGRHEEEVEKSPWLVKFVDCNCEWDERSYTINLCPDHAHLADEPSSVPNV